MPDRALAQLREGNARSVAGQRLPRDLAHEREALVGGQHPRSFVIGCIDSRVPPEVVFDAGLGELFVCRTAGTVVDDDVLAGVEYGVAMSDVKLVVVLGHTSCGAVTGACAGVQLGHLTGLLELIKPAVVEVAGTETPGGDDPELVDKVVEANVRHQMAQVRSRSDVVREAEEAGDIRVVGAVYHLDSGEVTWLE